MTETWCSSGDDSAGGGGGAPPVMTKKRYDSDDDDADSGGGGPMMTAMCSHPMTTERYSPSMKINRLLFLASSCLISKETQAEALKTAYRLIKIGDNPGLLRKLLQDHTELTKQDDTSWLKRADVRFATRKKTMESRIRSLQNTINVEEGLRLGFKDLGDLHYECGDLEDALTCYHSMRINSNTEKHFIDADMRLVLTSLKAARYEDCLNFVSQARPPFGSLDDVNLARLTSASGLAHLALEKYNLAATEFLRIDYKAGNIYPDVLLPQDAATYGALCSLAAFDRSEMKQTIIDNTGNNNGWKILGLAPHLRKCILAFYERDYWQCLQTLDKCKSNFLLDPYLSCHVETLYTLIRQNALMEYVRPFSCLKMETMAAAFNTTVDELEKELDAMISNNKLQAQIVSHDKAC